MNIKSLFIGWVLTVLPFAQAVSLPSSSLPDEDGGRLWLRFNLNDTDADIRYDGKITPVVQTAVGELKRNWKGLPVVLRKVSAKIVQPDGYMIKSSKKEIELSASNDGGLLYGGYALLRLQQTQTDCRRLDIKEAPAYSLRLLNHWDNLDGTIERGYAGRSLWKWDELPSKLSPRYETYARANASLGINGTVLNNVNASYQITTSSYLQKVKALADVFRPYGIRVYLSVNFASPILSGELDTADPLDKKVQDWWKRKVKEIYSLIPDFGGFLVKANSEGQPGPRDYHRTHAQGANMFAKIFKPYKGVVMWRAFVYEPSHDKNSDRAGEAWKEFMPLDGQFDDNVIVQIKNGPVDFQPREPYSPLFTSMQNTAMAVEFQITQEYLGHANHLVYLAPMWKEFFAQVPFGHTKALAGVANIGDDTNWCGHHFAQANWYAFGRLAWNPNLSSDSIAGEWLKQTFTIHSGAAMDSLKQMMLESREAAVNYMMPMGLHHIFAGNHHYGPEPWYYVEGMRPDWSPLYYHRADSVGLGFDRTATGSNTVSQYPDSLAARYARLDSCPIEYLLWFHHVPWNYQLYTGKTMWQELCRHYQRGVNQVRHFQQVWDRVEPYMDSRRFADVQHKLKIQCRDAMWWRDACLLYFQTFSHLPIPYELERPIHELQDMMQFKLNISNYECAPHGFDK